MEGDIIDLMSIIENDDINISSFNCDKDNKKNELDTFSDCYNNILIEAT